MNETKKKKRSFAIAVMLIIMTFALCMTLISCGGNESAGNDSNKAQSEQSMDARADEKDVGDTGVSDQEDIAGKPQKENKNDKEDVNRKTEPQKSTQKSVEKSTQTETQKATTEAATQAKKVCYITIEGYCSSKEIRLQGGDTAYSILCRSGASVSGSGHYIKGINGRFEFYEGPTSGWTYYVNGSKPTVGCGSCSVKAGDHITWGYVKGY